MQYVNKRLLTNLGAMYKLTATLEMLSPGTTSIFYIIIKSSSDILLKFKVAKLCENLVFPLIKGVKLIYYID